MALPLSSFSSSINLDRLRTERLSTRLSNLRGVTEFFDFKRISRPAGVGELQTRASYNLSYFASNYAIIIAMLSIYSLLTNLLLLFVLVFAVGGVYGISFLEGRDLQLGVARLSTGQMYAGLAIVGIPLGIYASPLSTILWLIGASGVSIGAHASLMERPVESSFAGDAV